MKQITVDLARSGKRYYLRDGGRDVPISRATARRVARYWWADVAAGCDPDRHSPPFSTSGFLGPDRRPPGKGVWGGMIPWTESGPGWR